MLKPDCLAAAFHSALVVSFADAGEIGFKQIVAGQREEPLREFSLRADNPAHRGLEIIVDAAPGDPAQVCKGPHVAVEKGELVTAFIEPSEFAPRVHQAQQELPGFEPLAAEFHHNLEEIDLCFARAVNQRHINLARWRRRSRQYCRSRVLPI